MVTQETPGKHKEENNINNNVNNEINININNDINININNFTNKSDENLEQNSKKNESKKEIVFNKEEGQSFSFNNKLSEFSLNNNEKELSNKSSKKKMDIRLDFDSFNNKINEYKERTSNKNSEVINSKNINFEDKNDTEEIKLNNSLSNLNEIKESNIEKNSENNNEDDGTLFGQNNLSKFDQLEKQLQNVNKNNVFNNQYKNNDDNNDILGFLQSNNNESDNIMNQLTDNNNGKSYNSKYNNSNESDSELSNQFNNNDIKKKDDKFFIIRMIDNTVSEYKIRYKCDLKELINKHSIIRALLHLKKNLISNNETNIINGRKLKEPNINVVNEYKIIHNKLFNYSEQAKIKNEHKRLIKCYSQMNIKNIQHNIKNNDRNIHGRKILKKISLKKTPINTNTNANQAISIIKNEYDNKGIKELFVDYNINKNNESNFSNSKLINESYKYQNLYDEQETKESIGTRANINLLNFRNNTSESNKEDDLSVISILNENEKNKFINFNKKIKYLKSLKKSSEKEKKHLEGFQKDEPKKPKEFNMNEEEPPKYRDFGEIYKKELETLEKLNPILFNLQKKKDENDMKKMIKKKEFKKLNEKIIMKGKNLKIKKSPSK